MHTLGVNKAQRRTFLKSTIVVIAFIALCPESVYYNLIFSEGVFILSTQSNFTLQSQRGPKRLFKF